MIILMAEDDADDRLLVREAWHEARIRNELRFVGDGQELLDYLHRRGPFAAPGSAPRPGLILLDLNMPRLDGREALDRIKSDPQLRSIPVIVLTTSDAQEEIRRTYELGANSFISKPVSFQALVEVLKTFGHYWFRIVELPPDTGENAGPP